MCSPLDRLAGRADVHFTFNIAFPHFPACLYHLACQWFKPLEKIMSAYRADRILVLLDDIAYDTTLSVRLVQGWILEQLGGLVSTISLWPVVKYRFLSIVLKLTIESWIACFWHNRCQIMTSTVKNILVHSKLPKLFPNCSQDCWLLFNNTPPQNNNQM